MFSRRSGPDDPDGRFPHLPAVGLKWMNPHHRMNPQRFREENPGIHRQKKHHAKNAIKKTAKNDRNKKKSADPGFVAFASLSRIIHKIATQNTYPSEKHKRGDGRIAWRISRGIPVPVTRRVIFNRMLKNLF
jgi:hypothetical protein